MGVTGPLIQTNAATTLLSARTPSLARHQRRHAPFCVTLATRRPAMVSQIQWRAALMHPFAPVQFTALLPNPFALYCVARVQPPQPHPPLPPAQQQRLRALSVSQIRPSVAMMQRFAPVLSSALLPNWHVQNFATVARPA